MTSTEERFWAKVERRGPDECWEWQAARDQKGYGCFTYQGRQWRAHRFAHLVTWGDIRPGLVVRHHCDNPACVNPSHLAQGTHADNIADRDRRGRSARGERCGNAALTDADVRAIRRRAARGEVQLRLAEEYGVTPANVSVIVRREAWTHV